jgi:HlyD family secretion protein
MAKSKKGGKTLLLILLLLLIGGGATAFVIIKKRVVPVTIQTETVARRNLTEIVVANGKIQPVLQVKISPEVSGEIIELPVKEGQQVKKGDLILKIKPDYYKATVNQAQANYESSLAGKDTAEANLRKATAEYTRNQLLFRNSLVSVSTFDEIKAAYDVARAQVSNSVHQVEMARASLASAEDALAKTTIVSPLTGTVSKLNSTLGERVVGTATMAGTEVMTIADLDEMEARVDIGENDVVLIQPYQIAHLEVDAFKDQKFNGVVTEIANSSTTAGLGTGGPGGGGGMSGGNQQEATKFSVKIRIKEKERFRPGMSVTAEIETRSRSNVLSVPIASVTTRVPKDNNAKAGEKARVAEPETNSTHSTPSTSTDSDPLKSDPPAPKVEKKKEQKPIEVVFVVEGDHVKMAPVKIGISDDSHWEITEGLREGQEVVAGGYKAISRELEDGKKIKKGTVKEEAHDELKKTE